MKKIIFFTITSILLISPIFIFFTYLNHTKKNITLSEQERTITVEELGITYTLPKEWLKNIVKNTSIYKESENDIFGEIKFIYATEENLEIISEPNFQGNIEYFTAPIARILVIKNEKEGKNFESIKSEYNSIELIGENCGYTYYLLYNYIGGLKKGNEKDIKEYEKNISLVSKLKNSIKFNEFNPKETINEKTNKLTFSTKTTEGDNINSNIFNNYDLTIVNFWGTYLYPDINETSILSELNEKIKETENINFIQVIIDTPSKDAEELISKIKSENNIKYTTIIPDENLSYWIINNLDGIPTTIFVNKNSIIIGETIKGTKTLEEYLEILRQNLELIKTGS